MVQIPYEDESEERNSFWADVYYYMEEHACDKEQAIRAVEILYKQ